MALIGLDIDVANILNVAQHLVSTTVALKHIATRDGPFLAPVAHGTHKVRVVAMGLVA